MVNKRTGLMDIGIWLASISRENPTSLLPHRQGRSKRLHEELANEHIAAVPAFDVKLSCPHSADAVVYDEQTLSTPGVELRV